MKILSDVFPIKNDLKRGDVLSPFLFNFAIENAFRKVQVNHQCLKLHVAHQGIVYANDINILGGCEHSTKKTTGTLAVPSKNTGLKVRADKTK
jgi:hypothetical protein